MKAIEEMVKFLEGEMRDPWMSIPGRAVAEAALAKARSLLAAEQSQTPTEAGLEEIWRDIYQRLLDGEYSYKQIDAVRNVMDEVIRRYHPTPHAPNPPFKIEMRGNNMGKMFKAFSDFMTYCSNGKTIILHGNNYVACDRQTWNKITETKPPIVEADGEKGLADEIEDCVEGAIWMEGDEMKQEILRLSPNSEEENNMDNEACQNEDRQLWQESDENGYRSLHVTKGGGIGINVGGNVWVMPLAKWHKLAVDSEASATPAYLEENAKLWAEAVKTQQELYRKNQSLQCEIDRLSAPSTENKGGDKCEYCIGSGEVLCFADNTDIKTKAKCPICFGSGYRPASPTKADKVESLAELADRKGWDIMPIRTYDKKWLIELVPHGDDKGPEDIKQFEAPTYAENEAKARAFLTGLDDVTGKGGR